jgi:outer membrane protein
MKAIRLIAASALCAALVVIAAHAQTRPAGTPAPARPATPPATQPAAPAPAPQQRPPASNEPVPVAKIAVVDTDLFLSDKGITKLLNAYQQLEREFQPKRQELQGLQNRVQAIADELQKFGAATVPVSEKTIQDKRDEGERLQREFEYKKKDYDALINKRGNELVNPIREEIYRALDAFAKARGITMILDGGTQGIILTLPSVNITEAFIADFNTKNPVAAATTPR